MSSTATEHPGIWFIYDGACPICNYAAHAFRIREKYGELHLLDARTETSHALLVEINRRRLDLDEGMVIVADGRFYHGKTALLFMVQFGEQQGWFNYVNTQLFRSSTMASMLYPLLRGVRNLLINLRHKGKIDNLRS